MFIKNYIKSNLNYVTEFELLENPLQPYTFHHHSFLTFNPLVNYVLFVSSFSALTFDPHQDNTGKTLTLWEKGDMFTLRNPQRLTTQVPNLLSMEKFGNRR
jgi:hypothetical protein